MLTHLINISIAAFIVSFSAYLSVHQLRLASFIVALPLATLLVLPMSYFQSRDSLNTVHFAKGIFIAVPASLLFFHPFLFANKFRLGFWQGYLLGIAYLLLGYFAHKFLFSHWA